MTWHVVTPEFPPQIGGISTWAAEVAGALHRAGETVVVHARGEGSWWAPVPFVAAPYPVRRLRGRWWGRWAGLWALIGVGPSIRRGDRVLCATWPMAEMLSRRWRVGVAAHGSDLTRPIVSAGRAAGRAGTLRRAAAVLPVSRFLGEIAREIAGVPYTVLPYPIRSAGVVARGEALLCVARLGRLKGVDRALRLGARLGREVRVVGEGPERGALERLAAEIGARARFFGALRPEQIPWEGCAALLLLSREDGDGSGAEGLGLVLLEAAARGLPGIGSRVGGIPEAAYCVLDDPEHDLLPILPGPEEVLGRLWGRHGEEFCVQTLKKTIPCAVDGI